MAKSKLVGRAGEIGRPVSNKYEVPVKQWNKWSRAAQRVFNTLYESMRPKMQWAFLHPEAALMSAEHWATTRWNAAWEAAQAANNAGILRRIKIVKRKRR